MSAKDKTEATSQMPDDAAKPNDDQLPVAVPPAQENACEIFKLDVDCCKELFDWLSIKDLQSMGQTCKRMHRIAGMYFQQTYRGASITSEPDGIYCGSIQVNEFSEFIEEIHIRGGEIRKDQLANCKSLKKIHFASLVSVPSKELHLISDVLAKVERIFIGHQHPGDDTILDFCPNLKHLEVVGWSNTDWLSKLNKCPKLELISLPLEAYQVLNMEELLNKMPNIRTIRVDWRNLLPNKDALLTTNVKLDNLIVETFDDDDGSVCTILNELYDRGFYKRLHLFDVGSIYPANRQFIDRMATLRALETLEIEDMDADFPVMPNVKKIIFHNVLDYEFTTFPSKLPNLQWILVLKDSIDSREAILPFIRGSKQLSRIIMLERTDKEYDENIFDLLTLNKEREKLARARKVIIYVPEETFLETKFAHGASHSLIEMKRMESLKLSYDCYWCVD